MNRSRIISAGGTFFCAVGIGFFMQNATPEPVAPVTEDIVEVARADFKPLSEPAVEAEAPSPRSQPLIETVSQTTGSRPVIETPDIIAIDIAMVPESALDLPEPDEPVLAAEPEEVCLISATADVAAGAMVQLGVDAPCFTNERVVVHHNGMMFTASTDDDGALQVLVPALSEMAIIIVEFANGEGAVASAQVPSLRSYDRVALQWAGKTGFQLHALEYGAAYGSDGHVWLGAQRDLTETTLGRGGFMTRLGEEDTLAPRIVEVYTFPSGVASRDGDIALSVEAEITAETCAQDIEAQSLQLQSDGTIRTQYLTLAVPDCSTVGDFLVLNNLVDDLKIAAN